VAEGDIEGVEATETEGEEQPAGEADFCFGPNGIVIDSEVSPVANEDEPLKISFEVINIGTAAGECQVDIACDSTVVAGWTSRWLEVGEQDIPSSDGYLYGIPAVSDGEHFFEAWATPGVTPAAYTSNNQDF
jgi:hypothetical protein